MSTPHKINKLEVSGNNEIVIQDVSGTHVYANSDGGAKQLISDFRQEIGEIRTFLKQSREPILQQFAEKIYNISKIENAHFWEGILSFPPKMRTVVKVESVP
jgi:hypothetical protein